MIGSDNSRRLEENLCSTPDAEEVATRYDKGSGHMDMSYMVQGYHGMDDFRH